MEITIYKTSFKKYIFSDKGSYVTWIFVFIGLVLFLGLNHIMRTSVPENFEDNYRSFIALIILGLYLVIFIGYYSMSYINFRIQQIFKRDNKKLIDFYVINDVEIFQDSFTIKPFRQNYDAHINIKPRIDKFEILKINNSLILLGQVSEMGLFRFHLRPILIGNDSSNLKLIRVKKPKIRDIQHSDNDLIVKFENSLKSINMLIIKNYDLIDNKN